MRRSGRGPTGVEDGFGLVEVVLSIFILLVVLLSTSYVVDTTVKQAAINKERVAASELAEQYLETLSNSALASLQGDISRDTLLTSTPVTVGGTPYNVWAHLEWATTGTPSNLCSSGNPPEVIRATVTVKWGNGIQAEQQGETSVINPPYGTLVPGDGFLSIQIVGANSTGPPADTASLINVPVSVTNVTTSTTTTYNPDQNGCVYLQEPAGDQFTVSLASPAGGPTFISSSDVTLTPGTTTPVTVSSAGLAYDVPKFHYDEAGTVTFTPQTGPIASNMPISVSMGGQLAATDVVPSTGTIAGTGVAANATSAPLFPTSTASNPTPYSVWYGDCTTEASVNVDEPSAPATFTLAADGSATVQITGLDALPLAVTVTSGGTPTATATVADPNAPSDGCIKNEVYGLSGFAGSGTAYSDSTEIIAQTYTVKVTDTKNSATTSTTMVVNASGVTVGSTTYPTGTPVPVTVS
ncbi:MAG TPA: hypothetical protein VMB72_08095 [Acidimicrobiales bacterium]|nr:hypothetical protein [Acidimicrobiales bacterium]